MGPYYYSSRSIDKMLYGEKLSLKNRIISFFKQEELDWCVEELRQYIRENYTEPSRPRGESSIRYCLKRDTNVKGADGKENKESKENNRDILYSDRDTEKTDDPFIIQPSIALDSKHDEKRKSKTQDPYNASQISCLLRGYSDTDNVDEAIRNLEQAVNQTFVDKLLDYIKKKDLRDSQVYKAAQVDKRLFSKIVSNRQYKPSKDTAVALALALELSLSDANDILSRAGYTLSHSSMRDVIIEYFFKEKRYNLMDLNYVLYRYRQKLIGRS